MPGSMEALILILLNLYAAWRYALVPIGPDEGMWLLWGFTGARPYRDFVDCKPPGIHLWMWLLAKLTGRRLKLVKFIHHAAVGAVAVAVHGITGSLGAGLLATAFLQSAWLYSYQSWMDQVSGGLLLLALVLPPYWRLIALAGAVLFNLKAVPPGVVILLGRFVPLETGAAVAIAALGTGLWWLVDGRTLREVWYGAVTVAGRIRPYRGALGLDAKFPPYSLLLIIPALGICLAASADPVIWGAVLAYTAFNAWGKVWRPNHWIPSCMVAAALPDPFLALLILLADWGGARFLLEDVWAVTYPAIAAQLQAARIVGEKLARNPHPFWANTYHTQLYVYAQHPPRWDVLQLEIRDVTPERIRRMDAKLAEDAPPRIILGPGNIAGTPRGYYESGRLEPFVVLS